MRVIFINSKDGWLPAKIVSGGQTGVDRAALRAAYKFGIETGGYVPAGRLAEDGPISNDYRDLIETTASDPAVRTVLNVINSDATLIISRGPLQSGSLLTRRIAHLEKKPCLHIDLRKTTIRAAAPRIKRWLSAVSCFTLNVAGPRASEDGEIYAKTLMLLNSVLSMRKRGRLRGPVSKSS